MNYKTKSLSKMVRGALFETFCSQCQIAPMKNIVVLETSHPCRESRIHINRFGVKGWSLEVKVWLLVKWVIKLKSFQNWFVVNPLEVFAFDMKLFQVKTLFLRNWSPLQSRVGSKKSIRKENLTINSKSLNYCEMNEKNKNENLSQMIQGAHFRAFFSR